MTDWRLYARDVANNRQAEIKVYRECKARLVYNDAGAWSLDMPTDPGLFGILPFRSGIVVARDGLVVFSGPVRSSERRVIGGRTDDTLYGGTDDTGSLARTRCLPVITGPPYTAAAYDERTGPAETLMRGYVHDNAALGAHIPRRITGLLAGTSGGLGATIPARARFDPLLDLLQQMAIDGGSEDNPLWFRVLQNSVAPGQLDFMVSLPVDRSRDVVFAFERRNLISFTEKEVAPRGNYAIAGGKGELEQQLIREWGQSDSINRYGRAEWWLNKTNLDSAADLDAVAVVELEDSKPRSAVTVVVRDTDAATAFVNYGISDRVTVVRDGIAATGLVREISLTITPDNDAVIEPLIALDGGIAA